MTLGFSTEIIGKKTYFIEKIWAGLLASGMIGYSNFLNLHYEKFGKGWDNETSCLFPNEEIDGKLHTIREDIKERWKTCNDIHFVINNRRTDRFQFAPVIKCVSVQLIEIKIFNGESSRFATVKIDNTFVEKEALKTLALNDGFDSIEDFFNYFNKGFTGKIIHWTDLKY